MKVHLVSVIGSDIKLLPHMLRHYRQMGIDSFLISLNLGYPGDPMIEEARRFMDEFGCEIYNVHVGEWTNEVNTRLYAESRKNPDDWYILADLDEFQEYPRDLFAIIEECESKGYDYIEGCFIDRIAADGGFPEIIYDRPIEDQFPLGCTFTYRMLGGYPLKVVAAKGHVSISVGNHNANTGVACPIDECFAQVHHYKWDKSVVNRMKQRAYNKELGSYMVSCRRFVDYVRANNGRIDVSDPRLFVGKCKPQYEYWSFIKQEVQAYPNRPGHISHKTVLNTL